MVQEKGKYTVITGASSGIGYETAKAFAGRGKNLVIAARRRDNLEMLKKEILKECPDLDVVIRSTDLSVPENAYQFYEGLKDYEIETWVNNAGFGNYDSVADQDLGKIGAMLHLNIEALTILSSLFVRDYKEAEGAQLINVSSAGGYTIVPTAGLIGRKEKNFRGVFDIFVLHLCLSFHFVCLSFPASQNNKKSADKIDSGT